MIVNTHPETSVDRLAIANSNPGVMITVQHPSEWPSYGHFIAAGSILALTIRPTVYSTSDDVRILDPDERQCNYDVGSHSVYIAVPIIF